MASTEELLRRFLGEHRTSTAFEKALCTVLAESQRAPCEFVCSVLIVLMMLRNQRVSPESSFGPIGELEQTTSTVM